MDGNTGLYKIDIHDNAINWTTKLAIYGWGGGHWFVLQNNRHDGTTMSNVSVPGAFASALHVELVACT